MKEINYYFLFFKVLTLLGLLAIVIPTQGLIITNSTDATSIKWSWDEPNMTKNIYVDSILVVNSTPSLGYYNLYNLNYNEPHIITIINASDNTTYTNTAKTSAYPWYFPLILTIAFIIIGMIVPFFCIIAIITAAYGLSEILNKTGPTWMYIMYGLLIVVALYTLREKVR